VEESRVNRCKERQAVPAGSGRVPSVRASPICNASAALAALNLPPSSFHLDGTPALAVLFWNPALPLVLVCAIVALLVAAFVYAYRRLTARFGRRRAWPVLAARGVLFLLLLVALVDPVVRRLTRPDDARRVLVLMDDSASMGVSDGQVARRQRARAALASLRESLPARVHLDVRLFADRLTGQAPDSASAGATPAAPAANAAEPVGTDIGAVLDEAAERAESDDVAAVVLLSDGGDEPIRAPKLPRAPLAVVGFGEDGSRWSNVAVKQVVAPESVEKQAAFTVEVDLTASGPAAFLQRQEQVSVVLLRQDGARWTPLATQWAKLAGGRARVAFETRCEEPGQVLFRVQAATVPGELSPLDNRRTFPVDVRREALDVLYYSRRLGADLKMLRQELGTDPALTFTALYRTLGERFTVQGTQVATEEELTRGFPTDPERLRRFDCIILGSFPAHEWSAEEMKVLLAFVEQGGGLVWLGGEESFDGGGYGFTPLQPLLPWELAGGESSLQRGSFAVSVPSLAAGQPAVAGLRELLAETGTNGLARTPSVSSINAPAALRAGSEVLMEAELPGRRAALVILHRYGKGRIVTVASNTTWQWARESGASAQFYRRFWRQAVRAVCGQSEGGRVLQVTWNKNLYRPGDPVVAGVRLGETAGVQLKASLSGPGGTVPLPVNAAGSPEAWQVEWVLRSRGAGTFVLTAERGGEVIETYRRTIPVAPLPDEGSRLACNTAELGRLGGKGSGFYLPEEQAGELATRLATLVQPASRTDTRSVVSGSPWFLAAVLIAALAELAFRRRLNLV
jgi:uncharacterized membrane protein